MSAKSKKVVVTGKPPVAKKKNEEPSSGEGSNFSPVSSTPRRSPRKNSNFSQLQITECFPRKTEKSASSSTGSPRKDKSKNSSNLQNNSTSSQSPSKSKNYKAVKCDEKSTTSEKTPLIKSPTRNAKLQKRSATKPSSSKSDTSVNSKPGSVAAARPSSSRSDSNISSKPSPVAVSLTVEPEDAKSKKRLHSSSSSGGDRKSKNRKGIVSRETKPQSDVRGAAQPKDLIEPVNTKLSVITDTNTAGSLEIHDSGNTNTNNDNLTAEEGNNLQNSNDRASLNKEDGVPNNNKRVNPSKEDDDGIADAKLPSFGLVTPRPPLSSMSQSNPWVFGDLTSGSSSKLVSSVFGASSSQETIPYQSSLPSSSQRSVFDDSDADLTSLDKRKKKKEEDHLNDAASACSTDTMSVDTNYRGSDVEENIETDDNDNNNNDDDDDDDDRLRIRGGGGGKNVEFYLNKRKSEPKGDFIENILLNWKGQYAKLEEHHGYIQWLFPIDENGMNCFAQKLTPQEAKFMENSEECRKRLIRSYDLMLDFYGFKLIDKQSGKLTTSDNHRSRFNNLNVSYHNNLRITRIIKCLGMLGFEHYQAPLLEILIKHSFGNPAPLSNCRRSCVQFWLPAMLDDKQRDKLLSIKQVREYKNMIDNAASRRSFINY